MAVKNSDDSIDARATTKEPRIPHLWQLIVDHIRGITQVLTGLTVLVTVAWGLFHAIEHPDPTPAPNPPASGPVVTSEVKNATLPTSSPQPAVGKPCAAPFLDRPLYCRDE